jgi:gliding motility-associated lipoprotein GldK
VNWVKDSIIKTRLAITADEQEKKPGTGGIGEFAFADADTTKMSVYDKYMYKNYYSVGTDDDMYSGRKLNQKVKLIKDTKKYPDELYVEVMDSMYLPESESYNGLKTIDASKLKFKYNQVDLNKAVKKKGRKGFYENTPPIEIYPDTTAWIKDFAYSYNEPMHNSYFWHQAYGDYPVVGVSWNQSKAFCAWRTMYKNGYIKKKKGRDQVNEFRLPTEAEWEYAARGGIEGATYPWGGPYAKNDRGCFLANFKPVRGDYAADGALYTVEAKSYEPNDFNLYNMAGNVAEWTESSYFAESYEFVSTMNPNVSDRTNQRKVVRGGSWKDVGYMLQVSTRDFEYADSARSYIGFRTVQDYMGTAATGNRPK